MKIRKIKFENHPILKDLELDFTDENGNTVNTIIIAGENGVGKSMLLDTIFKLTDINIDANIRDEKLLVEIELSDDEKMNFFKRDEKFESYISLYININEPIENILKINIDYSFPTWEQIKIQLKFTDGFSTPFIGIILAVRKAFFKTLYSEVEVNFIPSDIRNVTSKNIDDDKTKERSNKNLATDITQLLIDVQSLDALELNEWVRENMNKIVTSDKVDVRIKRFTNAFHYIFPTKRYKKIVNTTRGKEIIFEDNGNEMSIGQLSSGEKQIVFRGSFLLKNKQSAHGALVLIDEPELSLHPNWQLKILNFFKKLFTDENGQQTSQLIISTHSPFIVHNANRLDDKVIVLQKDDSGNIIVPQDPKFYSWTNEKFIQHAFNINHIISENKTTVFLEGETDEKYYNRCLEIFNLTDKPIEFKWIGRINEKGNAENTGDTALNQAKTFFTANSDMAKNKVILFYDNDTNKPEEEIDNLLIRKMIKNETNTIFKIGVENLLDIPDDFDRTGFYKQRTKQDDYGAESIIRELNKIALCNYICDELDIEDQKKFLGNIKNEVDRLLK